MTKEEIKFIPIGRAKDLTGQKFGKLTVLGRGEKPPTAKATRSSFWWCECDCGNIVLKETQYFKDKKSTLSCGCLGKPKQHKNIAGIRFGYLTALEPTEKRDASRSIIWKCRCDCGEEVFVSVNKLTTGNNTSCGKHNYGIRPTFKPGDRFGRIKILDIDKEKSFKEKQRYYICQCDCGTVKSISVKSLDRGITSCGCVKSKGEFIISKILKENNIPFEKEKVFTDCILPNQTYARFDFYVNNEYLIEFDGEQHFYSNKSGWNTEENLKKTQEYDNIKNNWCHKNNIPLIRIPYTHREDIELKDLVLSTSTFIIKENDNA